MSSKPTDTDDVEKRNDGQPPYEATDKQRKREADTLRELADELCDDLHDFADDVEANEGDPETYYGIVASIGSLHPAIEAAAESGAWLDAHEPEARAICCAFEGVHHASHDHLRSAAVMSLSSAAEYAELARDAADDERTDD